MSAPSLSGGVLLVDDETLVLDLLQGVLEEGGFAVTVAHSGAEALELLDAEAEPALSAVVTDVDLGQGPTGWDVATKAREINPNVAVIYMSGGSAHEWSAHGVPKSLVLQKPFAPVQVVTAVATLINEAHSQAAMRPPDPPEG
jgi:two-component system, cell cycle response regulator CpdR